MQQGDTNPNKRAFELELAVLDRMGVRAMQYLVSNPRSVELEPALYREISLLLFPPLKEERLPDCIGLREFQPRLVKEYMRLAGHG